MSRTFVAASKIRRYIECNWCKKMKAAVSKVQTKGEEGQEEEDDFNVNSKNGSQCQRTTRAENITDEKKKAQCFCNFEKLLATLDMF